MISHPVFRKKEKAKVSLVHCNVCAVMGGAGILRYGSSCRLLHEKDENENVIHTHTRSYAVAYAVGDDMMVVT